jgi:hypothetical protein
MGLVLSRESPGTANGLRGKMAVQTSSAARANPHDDLTAGQELQELRGGDRLTSLEMSAPPRPEADRSVLDT